MGSSNSAALHAERERRRELERRRFEDVEEHMRDLRQEQERMKESQNRQRVEDLQRQLELSYRQREEDLRRQQEVAEPRYRAVQPVSFCPCFTFSNSNK
ncbi:Golgi resident protein GCP60-like isoform X1 [Ostrea edulis]|uniref:Golgi resident protein GCP60-like isoform X1 n=1 Tax=Ostrea edulis TaxID=37623 RepID=UPI0024AF728A|nr:Golgi resident protein GCP60-like isoform X1 [Ostrea edulis]